jgi:hypothetical protein
MEPFISTIDLDGKTYQISRLTPKKAFHVARRLAPFLGAILPHLRTLFEKGDDGKPPAPDTFLERGAELLPAIADIIAKMPNDDCDFIIDNCLSVVSIKQDRGSAPVISNGTLMFDFIDLKTMMQLTAEVVKVNLSDFFPTSPPQGSGATATAMVMQ